MDTIIDSVADIQSIFNLFSDNGREIDTSYTPFLLGYLCEYSPDEYLDLCTSSELADSGLIGVKSFFSYSTRTIVDKYLSSDRQFEDQFEVLAERGMVDMQRYYNAFVRPAFESFWAKLLFEFKEHSDDYI